MGSGSFERAELRAELRNLPFFDWLPCGQSLKVSKRKNRELYEAFGVVIMRLRVVVTVKMDGLGTLMSVRSFVSLC